MTSLLKPFKALNYYLCVVYISDTQPLLLQTLKQMIANNRKVDIGANVDAKNKISDKTFAPYLIHSFRDDTYNRTSFYILQQIKDYVGHRKDGYTPILSFVQTALSNINFSTHSGTHPTLGAVDHISFAPIGSTSLEEVEEIAKGFCKDLYDSEKLPIYCYGSANMKLPTQTSTSGLVAEAIEGMPLRTLRRELGYFESSSLDSLNHANRLAKSVTAKEIGLSPDFGSLEEDFDPKKGVACVGAVPYVQNYNVKYFANIDKKSVSQITAAIRRPDIEALTLLHGEGGYESACNLKGTSTLARASGQATSLHAIHAEVLEKSVALGLAIERAYITGPSEDDILQHILTHIEGEGVADPNPNAPLRYVGTLLDNRVGKDGSVAVTKYT